MFFNMKNGKIEKWEKLYLSENSNNADNATRVDMNAQLHRRLSAGDRSAGAMERQSGTGHQEESFGDLLQFVDLNELRQPLGERHTDVNVQSLFNITLG